MKPARNQRGMSLPELTIITAIAGLFVLMFSLFLKNSIRSRVTIESKDDINFLRRYIRDNISCRNTMVQQTWGDCRSTSPTAPQPLFLRDRNNNILNQVKTIAGNPVPTMGEWAVYSTCDKDGLNISAGKIPSPGSPILAATGMGFISYQNPVPLFHERSSLTSNEKLCVPAGIGPNAARAQIWVNGQPGPGSVAVAANQLVTIMWNSGNSTGCNLSVNNPSVAIPGALQGQSYDPGFAFQYQSSYGSLVFTVTCAGEDGYPAAASVQVN